MKSAQRWAAAVAVALALAVLALRHREQGADHPSDYVAYQPGGLPVVLVVPHDGELARAGVAPRSVDPRRDRYTAELAAEIAQALEATTGTQPHIVTMQLRRRLVDANRVPDEAYEHPGAAEVYEAFHARVFATIEQVRAQHGGGVLLDLHGNWEFPGDLYVGTSRDRAVGGGPRFDERLRAAAREAGFEVPDAAHTPDELEGDHILARYGGTGRGRLSAAMVEVHERVRNDPAARVRMAEAIAAGVAQALSGPEGEQ